MSITNSRAYLMLVPGRTEIHEAATVRLSLKGTWSRSPQCGHGEDPYWGRTPADNYVVKSKQGNIDACD